MLNLVELRRLYDIKMEKSYMGIGIYYNQKLV